MGSPTAGRRYRVFVRVWNLGLLPAVGVFVRGWYVNPGFFGGDPHNPAYAPQPIGMVVVPELDERTKPGAMQVVELDHTWDIPLTLTGHECLMVTASCPLDEWGGVLDANNDRHVGQRNLTILAGTDDAKELFFTLGQLVTGTGTLELRHGGDAVTALLQGVVGETKTEFGTATTVLAPPAERLRHGVSTESGQHLMTMFLTDKGWLVADSARAWSLAVELGVVERGGEKGGGHPFGMPLGSRQVIERVIERVGFDGVGKVGVLTSGDPGEALLEGLGRLWGLDGLAATDLAAALTDGGPFAHLLRFSHTDPERDETGATRSPSSADLGRNRRRRRSRRESFPSGVAGGRDLWCGPSRGVRFGAFRWISVEEDRSWRTHVSSPPCPVSSPPARASRRRASRRCGPGRRPTRPFAPVWPCPTAGRQRR